MATEVNFTEGQLVAGADWSVIFDAIDEQTDAPLNMTDYGLEWVVRNRFPEGDVVLFARTPSDISVIDGAGPGSRAIVTIPSAVSLTLKRGVYYHALWRTDDPSDKPLAYGSFPIIGIAKQATGL